MIKNSKNQCKNQCKKLIILNHRVKVT